MAWSAEFGEPIELSDGLTFRTLRDAVPNILKLPKADQDAKEWQAAMHCKGFPPGRHVMPPSFFKREIAKAKLAVS